MNKTLATVILNGSLLIIADVAYLQTAKNDFSHAGGQIQLGDGLIPLFAEATFVTTTTTTTSSSTIGIGGTPSVFQSFIVGV